VLQNRETGGQAVGDELEVREGEVGDQSTREYFFFCTGRARPAHAASGEGCTRERERHQSAAPGSE
jgi:hypothetical protein